MRYPEEELLDILKDSGVDFTSSLPCEKIKVLIEMVGGSFFHVPLTREEEGVGISAGAALSGKRPAIFVQSSGIGNMINALLSLTAFYELPLAVFVSRRGIYREKIEAQLPMGLRLPGILRGAGISFSSIDRREDFGKISKKLTAIYKRGGIHAFLLNPALWEKSGAGGRYGICGGSHSCREYLSTKEVRGKSVGSNTRPSYTRYGILKVIAPYLGLRAVVCNLGFPSKELFDINDRPSNFYMLGSMGMATPTGLGVSLASDRQVVVIDGDGSLLMNPGTLATAAHLSPGNLTILAVDNGEYGSTGGQPTLAGSCVDLSEMARGLGIKDVVRAATRGQIVSAMESSGRGLKFVHLPAKPGNKDVPNINIGHMEIKRRFMDFLKA